jgi:hypothetical protein
MASAKLKTLTECNMETYSTENRADISTLSTRWYKPPVFHDGNYDLPKNSDNISTSHGVPEFTGEEVDTKHTITSDLDPIKDESGKLKKSDYF